MASLTLSCPLCCNQTFTCHQSLKYHLQSIVDNLLCPACKLPFKKLDDLIIHLDTECTLAILTDTIEATSQDLLQGNFLETVTKEPATCEEHESAPTPVDETPEQTPTMYYCSSCEISFSELSHHIKMFHQDEEITIAEEFDPPDKDSDCQLSSKAICKTALNSLKQFQCKTCSLEFLQIEDLLQHTIKGECVKPIEKPNCKCMECNTEFFSLKSLNLHKKLHRPKAATVQVEKPSAVASSDKFTCNICNKSLDIEFEEIHRQSHSNECGFICVVCNRTHLTKEDLEMHVNGHAAPKYFCSCCKTLYDTLDQLEEHQKALFSNRKYPCQYCGRRFVRAHEKVKHERIHTGEKPHECEICGKKFRVPYCLTVHMRTHTGYRPYECGECGKRFKSQSGYAHHLRTHSDKRTYKCPQCPKTFKNIVQLGGHRNTHIKRFACKECNRPFATLYAVRKHMESHQRINNLRHKCELCGATYARAFALRDHLSEQHDVDSDSSDSQEGKGYSEEVVPIPDESILMDFEETVTD